MNLPNKLTTLRVFMIPFFVFFLLYQGGENTTFRMISLVLFIVASLTDLLDGKIARKYNLVTNFGKFMDPLADKLLVCSALICLIELGQLPAWMVIIIISREFIISGFRLVASDNGVQLLGEIQDNISDGGGSPSDSEYAGPCPHHKLLCLGSARIDNYITGRLYC